MGRPVSGVVSAKGDFVVFLAWPSGWLVWLGELGRLGMLGEHSGGAFAGEDAVKY